MKNEPIAVTLLVINAFDALEIPYVIGGSFASSVHGIARTTMDSDLLAAIRPEHVTQFVQRLGGAFYVDEHAVMDAIKRRSSFNLIHLDSMFKVDVFIAKRRRFDQAQLANRTPQIVSENPERTAYFASAEDTILSKLEWYRMDDEISDRQWRDVLGVIAVQRERLNLDYLREQAVALGVSDLLEKALAQDS